MISHTSYATLLVRKNRVQLRNDINYEVTSYLIQFAMHFSRFMLQRCSHYTLNYANLIVFVVALVMSTFVHNSVKTL